MERVNDGLARTEPAREETTPAEGARLESTALARLIEEVRVGEEIRLDAYNRTYHRHNR